LAAYVRAAPEIFLGKPYDESVDMWACGVLLYMLYVLGYQVTASDHH